MKKHVTKFYRKACSAATQMKNEMCYPPERTAHVAMRVHAKNGPCAVIFPVQFS
jgi:hypothetical protein